MLILLLMFEVCFDKDWHEGLIHKLRQKGISGEALALSREVK